MIEKLRHRVRLQAPFYQQGADGDTRRLWEERESLWASVRAFAGDETVLGEGESALTRYEIIIRHRTDITAEMRFIFGTHVLNIKAVLDKQGLRRYLTCLCEESRDE